jgi:integrase/recombinase XerC
MPQIALVRRQAPTIDRLMGAFFTGRSPHTLRAYQSDLEVFHAFLRRAFGAPGLSQQDAFRAFLGQGAGAANELVLRYRGDLQARGKAASTINRHLAAVRSLVRLARLIGVVTWTLEVEGVRTAPCRDTRGPGAVGVAQLLQAAATRTDAKGLRDVAIVRVLYDLGLRCEETANLDVADLDETGSALWVRGKGRPSKELLSLPAVTLEALRAWLSHRGAVAGPLFQTLGPRGKARNGRLTTRAIYRIVRTLGARAGLKVWPHGLRHTAITEAVKAAPAAGIGLDEVRQFSRHANINTLLIYRDRERNVQGQLAGLVAATAKGGAR